MKRIVKLFTISYAIALGVISCTSKPKQEATPNRLFNTTLAVPGSGQTWKDTANGYEITYYYRDTVITVQIPYTYTNHLLDTTMRKIASSGSGGGDTSVTPPPVVLSGIEGFGSGAVGGSNSTTVYHVKNVNTSGTGSLAAGIGSNKTIVFDVDGTIHGRFDITGVSYMTIDATGHDITIDNDNAGDAISFDGPNTHHCILRNVRATDAGGDGINVIDGAHDIAIDHCTSWGNRDGNIDIAGDNAGQTKNVTVQWCMIGGGVDGGFSGSTLVTGQNVTLHHNLYVPNYLPTGTTKVAERCPYDHCNYSPIGSPNCDFRNNLIYKWGRYATGMGYKATINVVNNYYASNSTGAIDPNADPSGNGSNHANYYIAGNLTLNSAAVNVTGTGSHAEYVIPTQYKVTMSDAKSAAISVKANAGTSFPTQSEASYKNAILVN